MTATGVTLHLRVTPNAGRDAIDGPETRGDGSCYLRLRVSAVPDKGKANAAVIALLAKKLNLTKSAIKLVSGDTARFKTLAIAGDATVISKALETITK
ncbi:DUF167 domain-containing protein [Devosia sp. WQ 349]|uniref:DUF167 family protein n=1 Tax=Devosia sp. WQ 349K1 TaxID=2800329 RepID=UPI00190310F1|nr:DUF167 domain-containing protein [Devosia sp. WQ 349K1]